MFVGTLELELYLAESGSLKDKRRVIKSLLAQMHNKFNVSAAEVENLDSWQRSTLAVACVSNEKAQVNRVLNSAARFVTGSGKVEVIDIQLELL